MSFLDLGASFFPGVDPSISAQSPLVAAQMRAQMARPNTTDSYIARSLMRQAVLHPNANMPRSPRPGVNLQGSDYGLDPSVVTNPMFRERANQLLSPYGLTLPEYQGPNAILPNTGFFGNHPRLSAMLEGGIFGGAFTQPSDTVGEGISNVLQGAFFQGPAAKRQMLASRYMAPFSAAHQMENIMDLQGQRESRDADINYKKAMVDVAKDRVDAQRQRDTERIQATKPIPGMMGDQAGFQYYNPGANNGQGGWEFKGNVTPIPKAQTPTEQEDVAFQDALKTNPKRYGGSDGRMKFHRDWHSKDNAGLRNESPFEFYMRNNPPNKGEKPQAYSKRILDEFNQTQSQARAEGTDAAKHDSRKVSFMQKQQPSAWRKRGINPKDTAAQSRWYDENIGKYEAGASSQDQSLQGMFNNLMNSLGNSPMPQPKK